MPEGVEFLANVSQFSGYNIKDLVEGKKEPTTEPFDACSCLKQAVQGPKEQLQQNVLPIQATTTPTARTINEYASRLVPFDTSGGGHAKAMTTIINAMNGDTEALKQNYSISVGLIEQHLTNGLGRLSSISGRYDAFFQNFDNMLMAREAMPKSTGPYLSQVPLIGNQQPSPLAPEVPPAIGSGGTEQKFDSCKCAPAMLPPTGFSTTTRGFSASPPAPARDTPELPEENLVMMRDLAERDSIRSFVTMNPTVQVTTGNIMQEVDVNTMIAKIESAMEMEIAMSAERAIL